MADRKTTTIEVTAKDAVTLFEREHRDKPDDAQAHLNLGSAYYVTGDWDNALQEFQHALAANPNLDHARYYLGVLYAKKGDQAKARAEFESVLKGSAHIMLKGQARIQMEALK